MQGNKRPETMERITNEALAQAFIEEQVAELREQIGDKKVLLALSGGVDSSVVAALLIRAVGKQLVCVHVGRAADQSGRQTAGLRACEPRLTEKRRAGAGHQSVPRRTGGEPHLR